MDTKRHCVWLFTMFRHVQFTTRQCVQTYCLCPSFWSFFPEIMFECDRDTKWHTALIAKTCIRRVDLSKQPLKPPPPKKKVSRGFCHICDVLNIRKKVHQNLTVGNGVKFKVATNDSKRRRLLLIIWYITVILCLLKVLFTGTMSWCPSYNLTTSCTC